MEPDRQMDPDDFQQAWKAQSSQTRVTVDANLLQHEVLRSQRTFRTTIFWRDFREVVVGLLMLPYWFYSGITNSLPWTWWLSVPALVWMAGFMVVYRTRHKPEPSKKEDSLRDCVQRSLIEQEDQIWLLGSVFWWCLLPFKISSLAFFTQVCWSLRSHGWLEALGSFVGLVAILFGIIGFVYWLNRWCVRVSLVPRRQELLAMLVSLGDESAEADNAMRQAKRAASSGMLRRWMSIVATVSCLVIFPLIFLDVDLAVFNYDGPPRSSGPTGDSLARLITDLRKEKKLVGLAAMVMVDGQVEAAAAVGERKIGSGVPVEISDRWHLGGITKSITATMIARLIESGQMKWSDTLDNCFPEATIHADWKPVTLRQLLTDTAGAPVNFPKELWLKLPALGTDSMLARREAVLNVIAENPEYPPGEKYVYSNVSVTIAAAMAEKVTGATWDDLVKREVFEPLQLIGAGFGPPSSSDKTLEQPQGHRPYLGKKLTFGDQLDNTSIMAPSNMVHMTLNDLCTYATEHMHGDQGNGKLLTAETYRLLHTPELNGYACGWIKKEPSKETPYSVYWHNGSNTLWYALIVIIPDKNMVVAITSNDGDIKNAEAAAWEVASWHSK